MLSTLKYFRQEYIDHIEKGLCAGRQCQDLIKYTIDAEACTGCTLCAKKCPTKAIAGEKKGPHTIDQDKCVRCGVCDDVCNFNAVKILSGPEL